MSASPGLSTCLLTKYSFRGIFRMTFVLSSYRAECDAYSWFVTLGNDDIHPTARVSE